MQAPADTSAAKLGLQGDAFEKRGASRVQGCPSGASDQLCIRRSEGGRGKAR